MPAEHVRSWPVRWNSLCPSDHFGSAQAIAGRIDSEFLQYIVVMCPKAGDPLRIRMWYVKILRPVP